MESSLRNAVAEGCEVLYSSWTSRHWGIFKAKQWTVELVVTTTQRIITGDPYRSIELAREKHSLEALLEHAQIHTDRRVSTATYLFRAKDTYDHDAGASLSGYVGRRCEELGVDTDAHWVTMANIINDEVAVAKGSVRGDIRKVLSLRDEIIKNAAGLKLVRSELSFA